MTPDDLDSAIRRSIVTIAEKIGERVGTHLEAKFAAQVSTMGVNVDKMDAAVGRIVDANTALRAAMSFLVTELASQPGIDAARLLRGLDARIEAHYAADAAIPAAVLDVRAAVMAAVAG